MQLESKLKDVGLSIFSVMTQLANEQGAINLSQGFPDFDPHPDLIAQVETEMFRGANQYAPMQGVELLRDRIAVKTNSLYRAACDPVTEITVTSGATEALFVAITTVVRPGDEVILFEPAYDAYAPVIQLNGGQPVYLQMKYPDYHIDWDEVMDAVTPRTRLLIINSPHNPTGAVFTAEDMAALGRILAKSRLMIISDEVYEHIIFDGRQHQSILRYPDLASRSFVISSFGKTYHTTGWKVGYCIAPPQFTAEFRKIHQYVTFAVNTPAQHAFAAFMQDKKTYLDLAKFYQKKRDLFLALIAPSRFKALACHGTYFQVLDYAGITDESDLVFAKRMTTEYKVAAIPPSVFYHRGDDHRVLRFCFAKNDDTLKKAADKLCAI